jgi:hypothetical protein
VSFVFIILFYTCKYKKISRDIKILKGLHKKGGKSIQIEINLKTFHNHNT